MIAEVKECIDNSFVAGVISNNNGKFIAEAGNVKPSAENFSRSVFNLELAHDRAVAAFKKNCRNVAIFKQLKVKIGTSVFFVERNCGLQIRAIQYLRCGGVESHIKYDAVVNKIVAVIEVGFHFVCYNSSVGKLVAVQVFPVPNVTFSCKQVAGNNLSVSSVIVTLCLVFSADVKVNIARIPVGHGNPESARIS